MTSQTRRFSYEGMFLFPPAAAGDLNSAVDFLRKVMDRAGATIISMQKWDERRLAFEIKKHKRGLYLLVYFECDAANLPKIERELNLSEFVLRFMMTRADHLTREEIEAADQTQALEDEAKLKAAAAAQESETASAGVGATTSEG